jgi:hypothetical protein
MHKHLLLKKWLEKTAFKVINARKKRGIPANLVERPKNKMGKGRKNNKD